MTTVRALVSFEATVAGKTYKAKHGDVLFMPPGANWVRAGMAAIESGTEAPPRTVIPDDLTAIKGIGRRMQVLLADLSVTTLEDLINTEIHYLADEIVGASLAQVQNWKDQARAIMEKRNAGG